MRIRGLLPVLALLVASVSVVPVHAASPPFVCKWNGLAHIDSDWSFEAVRMDLGPGQGSCTGIATGPWTITSMQGYGAVESPNLFSWSVYFHLTSQRNGSGRTFLQNWLGRETPDCTRGPFGVTRYPLIPAGVGTMKLCPTVQWYLPPPEPIDVPIAFTWTFVPSRLK